MYYIGGINPSDLQTYRNADRMQNIARPSSKAYLCDSINAPRSSGLEWGVVDNTAFTYGIYKVSNDGNYVSRRRHVEKTNVSFADGHTETLTGTELNRRHGTDWSTSEMYGKLGYK